MKSDAKIQDSGDVWPQNISSAEIRSPRWYQLAPINKTPAGVSSGCMKHPTTKTAAESFYGEPTDPEQQGWNMAMEVASRLLIWMTDGRTLHERGVRASVAVYCIRPDLLNEATLEQIGTLAGCSRQAVHKLAGAFRQSMGMQK